MMEMLVFLLQMVREQDGTRVPLPAGTDILFGGNFQNGAIRLHTTVLDFYYLH